MSSADQAIMRQAQAQGAGAPKDPAKAAEQEEQRGQMIASILKPEAAERLARIKMVKPPHGRQVEDMLIQMVQQGQVKEQIGENQLTEMLEGLTANSQVQVKSFRKADLWGSDEEEDDDDWGN